MRLKQKSKMLGQWRVQNHFKHSAYIFGSSHKVDAKTDLKEPKNRA
jgi:hypothetical protein